MSTAETTVWRRTSPLAVIFFLGRIYQTIAQNAVQSLAPLVALLFAYEGKLLWKIVFGTGSSQADIFFCGEAPDADEEREGEAFIGKPGQLLSKITSAMGLSSENVFTTNILKWRPEHNKPYGNRPPTLDEMRFCLPYLKAQIKIIQPKVIVALGNTTVSGLLGHDPARKMGSVRGTWGQFETIPVMITFHPSYLLRNGTLKTKRMVWEDMLQVMEKCSLKISDQQRGFFLPKS